MMYRIRALLKSRVAAGFVAALLLNVGLAVVTSQTVLAADVNGCFIRGDVQWPHYSYGSGGVVSDAYWQCSSVPSTINLSALETGFYLWLCPEQALPDENWILNNCTFQGGDFYDIFITTPNQDYIRHAPAGAGAHGTGWWIACAIWYSQGPNGRGSTIMQFSPSVWVSG
jgi:hypothetical protein